MVTRNLLLMLLSGLLANLIVITAVAVSSIQTIHKPKRIPVVVYVSFFAKNLFTKLLHFFMLITFVAITANYESVDKLRYEAYVHMFQSDILLESLR